ncbi:MAG: hypothetical protein NZT61_02550 [Deltaproteobacteria bacterium]|nr:hypothetical protein [Deltaproteobacteria bacterium]MCX7952347.1 hypothetical protein [Deltaproteobacteria bacterium]
MLGDGSYANPKVFQLDNYKKTLLKVLLKLSEGCSKKELKIHTVSEISVFLSQNGTTIETKELVRMLYILEGWELCSPVPETKLTSNKWRLTPKGYEMVKNVMRNIKENLESVF